MDTLAVIPARGGSRGLRRKNLLPDQYGTPLFLAAAQAAEKAGCKVVVATDDVEIRSMAEINGFDVVWRFSALADVPVGRVVDYAADGWPGEVLMVQPTVQPMNTSLLTWFLDQARAGRIPATLGVEARHLMWQHGKVLTPRLERQETGDWPVREMGVRWWPSLRPGLSAPSPGRVITAPFHLVDIDDSDDYRTLERRLAIEFIVVANRQVGHGHLHRALTLAEGMQHHDVTISTTSDTDPAVEDQLIVGGWARDVGGPDVVVYDCLDLVPYNPTVPSVAFETDTTHATVSINALYGHGDYSGPRYAVLRQEFLTGLYRPREDASRVMVMFGGTDPSHLTELTVKALDGLDVDVVRPEHRRSVAAAMHQTDLLVTSGGRTVFEAAAVGVPTVVMTQNMREQTHTHLGVGNINLGNGLLVDPDRLRHVVDRTLADWRLRMDMSDTAVASVDGYGAARVRRIIEHVGLFSEKP